MQARKKLKIEMMKYCILWGFKDTQAVAYFKERGVKLSRPNFYILKRELRSDEATEGWYTEQAISIMAITHKQSVEQLAALIEITMSEIEQLQSTPVYVEVDKFKTLNEQHDSIGLAKMMDSLTKLISVRDDMLCATPGVQAVKSEQALKHQNSLLTR